MYVQFPVEPVRRLQNVDNAPLSDIQNNIRYERYTTQVSGIDGLPHQCVKTLGGAHYIQVEAENLRASKEAQLHKFRADVRKRVRERKLKAKRVAEAKKRLVQQRVEKMMALSREQRKGELASNAEKRQAALIRKSPLASEIEKIDQSLALARASLASFTSTSSSSLSSESDQSYNSSLGDDYSLSGSSSTTQDVSASFDHNKNDNNTSDATQHNRVTFAEGVKTAKGNVEEDSVEEDSFGINIEGNKRSKRKTSGRPKIDDNLPFWNRGLPANEHLTKSEEKVLFAALRKYHLREDRYISSTSASHRAELAKCEKNINSTHRAKKKNKQKKKERMEKQLSRFENEPVPVIIRHSASSSSLSSAPTSGPSSSSSSAVAAVMGTGVNMFDHQGEKANLQSGQPYAGLASRSTAITTFNNKHLNDHNDHNDIKNDNTTRDDNNGNYDNVDCTGSSRIAYQNLQHEPAGGVSLSGNNNDTNNNSLSNSSMHSSTDSDDTSHVYGGGLRSSKSRRRANSNNSHNNNSSSSNNHSTSTTSSSSSSLSRSKLHARNASISLSKKREAHARLRLFQKLKARNIPPICACPLANSALNKDSISAFVVSNSSDGNTPTLVPSAVAEGAELHANNCEFYGKSNLYMRTLQALAAQADEE